MELLDNIPVSFSVEQVLNRLQLGNSEKFAKETVSDQMDQ